MPINEVNVKENLRQLNYLEQLHKLRMERRAYAPDCSSGLRGIVPSPPSSNGGSDTSYSGSTPNSPTSDEIPLTKRSTSIPSLPLFDPLPPSIDEEPVENPLSEFLLRKGIEAFIEERTAARMKKES